MRFQHIIEVEELEFTAIDGTKVSDCNVIARLTVDAYEGDPGDYWTPPTSPEFEVAGVELTLVAYDEDGDVILTDLPELPEGTLLAWWEGWFDEDEYQEEFAESAHYHDTMLRDDAIEARIQSIRDGRI